MNRPDSLRVGETLIQTLWVGGLWIVGYVVAPSLFARLDDTRLAGELAGGLFDLMAWISMVCGLLLVAAENGSGRPPGIRRLRRWLRQSGHGTTTRAQSWPMPWAPSCRPWD